jgi:hypothetical protein
VIELFTSSYRRFDPGAGVAVQASNSRPKWLLPYPLVHVTRLVTPRRALVFNNEISDEEFSVLYRQDLDRTGVERVRDELQAIAESAGDTRLVICCFEWNPHECHRSDFGSWWAGATGDIVIELPSGVAWDASGA